MAANLLERLRLNKADKIRHDPWRMSDFWQHVHLQVWCEWIRKPHVARKCTEYQVTHLDAVRRNDITESIVIVTEEFWEVVQQNEQNPHCALHTTITGFTSQQITNGPSLNIYANNWFILC